MDSGGGNLPLGVGSGGCTDAEEIRRAEEELLEQHRKRRSLGRSPVMEKEGVGGKGAQGEVGAGGEREMERDECERRKRNRDEERTPPGGSKRVRSLDRAYKEVVAEDPYKELEGLAQQMEKWLTRQAKLKMASKVQLDMAWEVMGQLKRAALKLEAEKEYWRGRVDGRQEIIELMRSRYKDKDTEEDRGNVEGMRRTYREVVGGGEAEEGGREGWQVVKERRSVRKKRVVLVREEGKESEEVVRKMKEVVKPGSEGLKVLRTSKIRNGVAIEVEGQKDVDALKKNRGMKEAGLEVREPRKRKPMILIYDVRADTSDAEICREVRERNLTEMEESEIKEQFQIKKRNRKEEGSGLQSVVVECSAEVRRRLRENGERLFLEWRSCKVKEYVDVPRCFKCQRHGHVGKYCKEEKACPRCAGPHDLTECQDKGSVRCVNCTRERRESREHDARDRECPCYKRVEKRYRDSVMC